MPTNPETQNRENNSTAQAVQSLPIPLIESLFEEAPGVYLVTDADGTIALANRAATDFFKSDQEPLAGKSLSDYIAAADRSAFVAYIARLSDSTAREQTFTMQNDATDTAVRVLLSGARVGQEQTGAVWYGWWVRPVLAHGDMQRQLDMSDQRLYSLLAATPLAVVLLDREQRVQLWNKTAETMFGWKEAEVLGKPIPHIPAVARPTFERSFGNTLKGKYEKDIETVRQQKDGRLIPVRLSTAPWWDESDEVIGILGLAADITEEVENRRELRETELKLREAREEERRRLARDLHDDAVQRLVGLQFQMVRHRKRLKAPLIEWVSIDQMNTELAEMERDLKAVTQLLRETITVLRPPGLEEFGLCQALRGFVSKLNRERSANDPVVTVECAPEAPAVSLVIATLLFRATQEALRNIYRHAHAQHATITLTVADGMVTLTISDDGKGFTVPPRLTELARDNHFGLVGIAEECALLQGTFSLESSARGTTLTIVVPLTTDIA